MPVSPREIDSVERVSRAIRWAVLGSALRTYPCTFGPAPTHFTPAASAWLNVHGPERLTTVLRNPTPLEIVQLDLRAYESARREFDDVSSEYSKVSNEVAERRGRSIDEVRDLTRRKAALRAERAKREATLHALQAFVPRFRAFLENLPVVNHCPVCPPRRESSCNGRLGGEGYLSFQCEECGTAWGNRVCGFCHERIPILEFSNAQVPDFHIPGEIDRILGCDVLALPFISETGKRGFLCPSCGELS